MIGYNYLYNINTHLKAQELATVDEQSWGNGKTKEIFACIFRIKIALKVIPKTINVSFVLFIIGIIVDLCIIP